MSAKTAGQKVLAQLNEAGYAAYFIGGMVRDTLLHRKVYDADIATDALPEEVLDLFDKAFTTGIAHGTVTVVIDHENVEVTTFRLDGDYLDHRRPDHVTFTRSLFEDLARRDYTINAIAQNLDGRIIDPFHGQADLEAGVLRAVGDPKQRFEEDALRILRGIRFVAKLGFDVEKETVEAMKTCRHLLAHLSLERIRKELEGIIDGEHRVKAFRMMLDYELFDHIPYFAQFGRYDADIFTNMDDFKFMLLLAEKECGDPKGFWVNFPLMKSEKKLIKDVVAAYENFAADERDVLTHYHFGLETARMLKKYQYYKETDGPVTFTPCYLPITSRSDLTIQPEEIIKRSGRRPGAWVSRLFTEIEEAVVLGKLENTRDALITFTEERGIFDEKEN